jgi:hypothetical protein
VEVTQEIEGLLVTNEYVEAQLGPDGSRVSGDWLYDEPRNSIRFLELVPEPLSRITIRYTLLASAQSPDFREATD